jgi:hypothetical protein
MFLGTAAFILFGIRPYFVLDTPKNKYLTSGPEVSDNLSELMTSVALGPATTIDKDGVLKWGLHNFLEQSSDFSAAEWTADNLEDAPALQADGSYLIVPDTTGGTHRVIADIGAVTATDQITFVLEVKAAGYDYIAIALAATPFAGEVAATWNIATGALTATSGGSVATVEATAIKRTADGWGYEVTLKSTAGSAGNADVRIIISDDGTLDNFEGDGTSGVYIRKARAYYSSLGGMQLSSKDGTDYLPTSGAAGYALRRDYSRLPVKGQTLGEPAGINLVPNSDLSAGWASAGATITPNNAVSLSGQTDAATVDLTTTGSSFVYQTCTVAASTLYTASWDGKPGTATAWVSAFYDESNGAWVARAEYTLTDAVLLANGWYRYSVQVTTPSGCTSMRVYPARNDAGSGAVAGTQGTTDFAFVQLEAYHIDTSRIPTYGASEARAKDEASTVIADSIPGFIQGSGSLVFEGSVDYETGGSTFPAAVRIDNGGDSSQIPVFFAESTGAAFLNVTTAWASQSNVGNVPVASGEIFRSAGRWDANDIAFSADGSATAQDTSGTIDSNMTHIRLGDDSGVKRPIRISHLSIGPYASPVASPGWSNAQLAVISGS